MHVCVYFCGIRFCSFSDIFQDMTADSLGVRYCPTMLLCDLQHVWPMSEAKVHFYSKKGFSASL